MEERRGGFKAAILRELGFPVSKRRLSVWIMFINDEPMAAILAALGDRPDFFMLLKVDYKGKARRLIGGTEGVFGCGNEEEASFFAGACFGIASKQGACGDHSRRDVFVPVAPCGYGNPITLFSS